MQNLKFHHVVKLCIFSAVFFFHPRLGFGTLTKLRDLALYSFTVLHFVFHKSIYSLSLFFGILCRQSQYSFLIYVTLT